MSTSIYSSTGCTCVKENEILDFSIVRQGKQCQSSNLKSIWWHASELVQPQVLVTCERETLDFCSVTKVGFHNCLIIIDLLTATLVNMGHDLFSKPRSLFSFAVIRCKCRSQVSLSEITTPRTFSLCTRSKLSIKKTNKTVPSRLPWGTSDETWDRYLH